FPKNRPSVERFFGLSAPTPTLEPEPPIWEKRIIRPKRHRRPARPMACRHSVRERHPELLGHLAKNLEKPVPRVHDLPERSKLALFRPRKRRSEPPGHGELLQCLRRIISAIQKIAEQDRPHALERACRHQMPDHSIHPVKALVNVLKEEDLPLHPGLV